MTKNEFQRLLTREVSTYKSYLETDSNNDWIVKGFIDVDKNVYTITNDTKVLSKIIEILLIPKLESFAKRNNMTLELPSSQNYYPDLTFIDDKGNHFAVDFKSSFYKRKRINGLTLGSYWGYFRNRDKAMNTDHPYNVYKCHLVIGMLYQQSTVVANEKQVYGIDELDIIKSVIDNFIFFVQPKWKIAIDRPGSGNTRNIGGVKEIKKLIDGKGPFTEFKDGEKVFDDYWMNYYGKTDAKNAGMSEPKYYNLETYKQYLLAQQQTLGLL